MATRAEALASAAWQARQHATETDALSSVQWDGCLSRAWNRLWSAHPEAFHINGDLVGRIPALPAAVGDELPIDPLWLTVLGAAMAADAVGAIAAESPERAKVLVERAGQLEVVFMRGLA